MPEETTASRKIIHVDADCFYAAIEMRDDPALQGKPMAVGGSAEEQDRRNRMGRRDLNINLDGSDDGKTAIIRKVLSVNMDVEIQDDTHRIVRIFKKSVYFAVSQGA